MAIPSKGPDPERGDIWGVDFDPQVGSELKKERPAVVMSVRGVGKLPLRIVIPITEWSPAWENCLWLVKLVPSAGNGLTKESAADTFQVKSVSLERFRKKRGELTDEQLDEISAAVAMCVGYR